MGKKSFTKPQPREDAGFNPFREVQKLIGFARETAREGKNIFSVYVVNGLLEWTPNRLNKKHPGFIAVIDCQKFGDGLTTKQWRKLEERVAIEMCKQRKAW